MLSSYLYMLQQANPGSVINLLIDSNDRFLYVFFYLKACIDGFLSSIKPVIAFDGTFLYGPHKEVLFVTMYMDGNDQIFPLAFGVGDFKSNNALEWFLTKLYFAIGKVVDLVIVSDRCSSIINAVVQVFLNSFYAACVVHLERNMFAHHGKIKTLKKGYWKVVKEYRMSQFARCMEHLTNLNPEDAIYITGVSIDRYSCAYCPRRRCTIISTNIAKSMNSAISDCKELPITWLIEYTRGLLQCWFHDWRAEAFKMITQLTTVTNVAIGLNDDDARIYIVYSITFYMFLVKDEVMDGIVDLATKSCTCRQFDLNQFPYAYALACIRLRRYSYLEYYSPYYSFSSLIIAYSGEINAAEQPSDWLVLEYIAGKVVLPSKHRRGLRRPKNNRIPLVGEEVKQRKCTNCSRHGHNSHTCTYLKETRVGRDIELMGESSGSNNVAI